MRLASPRELNRATLARQLLLDREPLSVADAARRVVALQARRAGCSSVHDQAPGAACG